MKKLIVITLFLCVGFGCSPEKTKSQDKMAFVKSFMEACLDSDYDYMYENISSSAKETLSVDELQSRYTRSEKITGGMKEYNLLGFDIDNGARVLASISIIYQNRNIEPLTIKNWIHMERGNWKVSEGPLLKPLNLKWR